MKMDGQEHPEGGNQVWGTLENFLSAGGHYGNPGHEKVGSHYDRYGNNKDKQSFGNPSKQ
jgi:hypothetical protein